MKRMWQILNLFSVAFAVAMNIVVGAQLIDVPSIKDMSDKYATFLTPATYAFSIWGLIYLLLVVFAIYQARDIFKPNSNNQLPERAGPYFVPINIGNALWTYVFVAGLIGLSVVIIVGMAVLLFLLLYRLNIAMFKAKLRTIICVWWPIMLYAGWVFVASIVNIASWLASLGVSLSQFAALAILIILCGAPLVLLATRNLRELVLASTWGIVAVGIRQMQTGESVVVATAALTVGVILLLAVATHAYRNRQDNILGRILMFR